MVANPDFKVAEIFCKYTKFNAIAIGKEGESYSNLHKLFALLGK